jgi:hypothetical protein
MIFRMRWHEEANSKSERINPSNALGRPLRASRDARTVYRPVAENDVALVHVWLQSRRGRHDEVIKPSSESVKHLSENLCICPARSCGHMKGMIGTLKYLQFGAFAQLLADSVYFIERR